MVIPCPKKQFEQRMAETKVLGDDFYIPNRAQLMLNFLQKHGDRLVKEKPGPRKRFSSTRKLVHHAMKQSATGSSQ